MARPAETDIQVDPNKDYTGKGTGDEQVIGDITTPEALQRYMDGGGKKVDEPAPAPKKKAVATSGTDPKTGDFKLPEENEEEEEEVPTSKKKGKPAPEPIEEEGEEEEETEDEDEDEDIENIVVGLDKEFELGLNLKALPENMTRAQEFEAVASILRRVNDGFQARIGEYEAIDEVLKDKEVADFIKAKREGKTLKDIATAYAASPVAAPDDVLVSRHTKLMYPTMTDAEIAEHIAALKDRKLLEKTGAAARKYFEDKEIADVAAKEAARVKQAEEDDNAYKEDLNRFGQFVSGTNKVYGVPITTDMKKRIFSVVTQRDAQGLTQHDRLLQSDANVFLSTLGILYFGKLLKDGAVTAKNKGKQELEESLFDKPDKLRSGSDGKQQPGFNPNLANQF